LPPAWSAPSYQFNINQGSPAGTVAGSVMATDPEAGLLNYTITSGNTNEAFSLNPYTGTLSLSNPAALIPGQTFALSLRVHDDGRKGLFPLQATPATAAITVVRDLVLLSPKNPGVNLPANQGLELETAGSGRPGAALTWSKVSGPGDVRFDDAGSPATGATFSTPGFYVIRATETAGGIPLTLDLTVQAGAAAALPHGRRIGLHNSTPAHTYFQGSWQINAGGTGLSNSPADSFYFINQTGRDTSSITARISAVQNVNGPQSMAGLMIRDGPGADARSVFCAITSSNGLRVITRSTPGLPSRIAFETNAASSFPFVPVWLRLIRLGDNFTAFSAPDLNGLPGSFTPIGTSWSVPMNPACFIGLAATSGSAESRGTFTIEDLSISPSLANLAPAITLSESVSLALHDTAALNGAVTDDSLPADPGYFTAMWKKTSGPGAVTFGSTSAPGTTASFATAGSYQLRLSAGDGEVRTFREVRLMIGRSPIEDWRDTKFGETTAFPGQSGDFADPDQDNLNNLLEYALNLEPLLPSVPDIAPVISGVGSRRYPGLNVTRNPDATDITMAIETTGTPDVAASWVTTGIIIEINTPTQLRARTTTPMDDSQRQFLRLKVSR
jgi:hypothetical protein